MFESGNDINVPKNQKNRLDLAHERKNKTRAEINESKMEDFDSKFESEHDMDIANNQVGIEIQCLFCKVPLENQEGLDIHVDLVHERKKFESIHDLVHEIKKFESKHEMVHERRKFESKRDLVHEKKKFESKYEMVHERRKFESEHDMNIVNNQVGIEIQCLFCEVSLENQNDLDIHVALVHERKKIFLCSLCPTTCVSKLELSRHITSAHKNNQTNIELSQCLLCPGPLTFYEIRHLKDHNSKIHK